MADSGFAGWNILECFFLQVFSVHSWLNLTEDAEPVDTESTVFIYKYSTDIYAAFVHLWEWFGTNILIFVNI